MAPSVPLGIAVLHDQLQPLVYLLRLLELLTYDDVPMMQASFRLGLDPIPQLVRREQLVQLNVSLLHANGPCIELAMFDPRWIELATV